MKFRKVALRAKQLQIATGQRESPETIEISGLFGCGGRTRTSGLRVMSCVRRFHRAVYSPFQAFVPRCGMVFEPLVSVVPAVKFPVLGKNMGQKAVPQQQRLNTGRKYNVARFLFLADFYIIF